VWMLTMIKPVVRVAVLSAPVLVLYSYDDDKLIILTSRETHCLCT
jgi:hypothetical protein